MSLFACNCKPNSPMLRKVYCLVALILIILQASAQDRKNHWVDSIFQRLTLPEKIGQLFMVPVSSDWTGEKAEALEKLVTTYHIGGIYLTHGGPVGQ